MGSLLSTEGDALKYDKSLVRWRSCRAPSAITLYLVTSKWGFWSVAIEFQRTPESAVPLDLRTFSGMMCIPQLLANRRIYMQVINWPCERTVAAFPIEGSTVLRIGTTEVVKTKIATYVSEYETCDLLACGLGMHIQGRFEELCKQLHPDSHVPASTTLVINQDGIHDVKWPASEFPQGDYWDELLNDKSALFAVLHGMGNVGNISYPHGLPIDLTMATLITKADILSASSK